jgi:uncharacterized coiled-coil DUF342 family protein
MNLTESQGNEIIKGIETLRKERDTLKEQNAKLMAACKEFVRRCECGEVLSRKSYKAFKAVIKDVECR